MGIFGRQYFERGKGSLQVSIFLLVIAMGCEKPRKSHLIQRKKDSAGKTENSLQQGIAPFSGVAQLKYDEIQGIIAENCLNCHGPNMLSPDLSTRETVIQNRSKILRQIEENRMPPVSPPGKFAKEGQRELLLAWLKNGVEFGPIAMPGGAPQVITQISQGIARLEPRQISRFLNETTGYREGYTRDSGFWVDFFVERKSVPLGGIDKSSLRDKVRATRVQTVLSTRMIAANASLSATNVYDKTKPPGIFIVCRPFEKCRPFIEAVDNSKTASVRSEIMTWETSWKAQLEHLYLAFFSRPPSPEEVTKAKEIFTRIFLKEKESDKPDGWEGAHSRMAWTGLLFGIMSSTEFWHN